MKINITADELAILVGEVIRVVRMEGMVIPFAAREVALKKFGGNSQEDDEQREMLVSSLVAGVNLVVQRQPKIEPVMKTDREQKSPPRRRRHFVDPSRDPYEVAHEVSTSNFKVYSL